MFLMKAEAGTQCQQTGSQNPYYSDHAVCDLYCDDGVRGNFASDGRKPLFDTICTCFGTPELVDLASKTTVLKVTADICKVWLPFS